MEALNMLHFLQHISMFGHYKRQQVAEYLPDIVLDQFHALGVHSNSK